MISIANLSVQTFIRADGERYCLLLDSRIGLPIYHPNLFMTTQIRNASLSFSMMESVLLSISVLLRFCNEMNIDLVGRFYQTDYLRAHEIEALSNYCQLKLRRVSSSQKIISITSKKQELVTSQTTYIRLTNIACW